MQQDLRANINIQNLLEINEQLKAELIKYKPEFETEFDEQNKTLTIHMKYMGKVFTTLIDEDFARYYGFDINHLDAMAHDLLDDIISPFQIMLKEELKPFIKTYLHNLETLSKSSDI